MNESKKKVEIKDLIFTYDGQEESTLKNINLEIDEGEFIVLVGPSGCGKSTLLKVITGLEDVTSGEVRIDDELMNYVEPKKRGIGMVFQNYALYPHLTIKDNISFGLKNLKFDKKRIEKITEDVGKKLELVDQFDKLPKNLSGGQQQRVALARAIAREPEVYLFDEPLSNLDAKLRTKMRIELLNMHNDLKKTFIYVTHDQVEAMTLASRIVVLNKGSTQQIDTPQNIFRKPSNLFVAQFIGYPEMNILTVAVENGRVKIDGAQIKLPKKIGDEYENKKIVVGFRADEIDYHFVEDKDFPIELNIISKEVLGVNAIFYCEKGEIKISVVVKIHEKLMDKDKIYIKIDPKNCLFFDPKTELRVDDE